MKRSDQINELTAALAKAQAEIEPAPKSNVAKVRSDKGNFEYYYADLAGVWEACREPLAKNGLAVIQTSHVEGNKVTVTTLLSHSSGQFIENDFTLMAAGATPQLIGGAITYARRYELSAMVGVASEKDDDSGGGDTRQPQRPQAPATSGPRETDPCGPLIPPKSQPKPEAGSLDDEDQALKAAMSAATPDAMVTALARVQNLPKEAQVEPRIALARQVDLYLGTGKDPTDDIRKLMVKIITGLPDERRSEAKQVYDRYKWSKSNGAAAQ